MRGIFSARRTDLEARTPPLVQIARAIRLGLHFLRGAATVGAVYPFVRDSRRLSLKQRWSRQLLDILGIELDASLGGIPPGCLIVANHISWLDIFVLNAARPVAFVSKAEVRRWPLIGWLSARTDTVFLMRGSRGHARVVNRQIDALLNADKDVALFPEGTTTDGSHLLHFHAALLQPAVETERPIQPVALSYHLPNGQRCEAAAYAGDTTMAQCMRAILATPKMTARLRPEHSLDPASLDRRELATAARRAIAFSLGLPLESTAPGTPAGLPDELPSDVRPKDNLNQAQAGSAVS